MLRCRESSSQQPVDALDHGADRFPGRWFQGTVAWIIRDRIRSA